MGHLLDGLNHVAIRVRDIEACARFYRDVLHLYLRSFDGQMAFFECGGTEFVLIGDPGQRDSSGQLAHIGFRVENPEKLDYFAHRVAEAGCPNIDGPKSTPGGRTLYFTDPEGIVVEIYC
ncbi:MAG: VOC family protein [Candidatus Wallbacteria bacterium]|nr:VOC family protein [Candidatus Wallbacteria bacterium]